MNTILTLFGVLIICGLFYVAFSQVMDGALTLNNVMLNTPFATQSHKDALDLIFWYWWALPVIIIILLAMWAKKKAAEEATQALYGGP